MNHQYAIRIISIHYFLKGFDFLQFIFLLYLFSFYSIISVLTCNVFVAYELFLSIIRTTDFSFGFNLLLCQSHLSCNRRLLSQLLALLSQKSLKRSYLVLYHHNQLLPLQYLPNNKSIYKVYTKVTQLDQLFIPKLFCHWDKDK